MISTDFMVISEEVRHALATHQPVVALESTIITHGMPSPQNVDTAIAVENMLRDTGATPATIAILNGKIKIGLTRDDLSSLVTQTDLCKASQRDIPFVIQRKGSAGTTVAATLFCAHHAGIRFFATGGIGGVHRDSAWDVSADLIALSQTPIAVICAGAKAILDLPNTLEFLETHQIPVIGYQSSYLPAFYSAASPYPVPHRVDTVDALANLMDIHWALSLPSGVLITQSIPESHQIPYSLIEPVIQQAIQEAKKENILGNALTPFLLDKIKVITKGNSLDANIALIKNNAALAGKLAVAWQSQQAHAACQR